MKKFNLKLITPLILTFILQGCMPDSLTKFKKDPPKKAAAAPVATVVDAGGTKLVFTPPTYLHYGVEEDSDFTLEVGKEALISMTADGSLNDATVQQSFIKGCALVTTGNPQTRTLPAGLTLDPKTCIIKGTPTSNKSVVTPFCSNPAIADQATCESTPLVWDSATETCSNIDFKYSSQSDCESAMNYWFAAGSIVPYLVELTFNDADGIIYNIFATAFIGTYGPIANFKYTQTDKLLLPIGTTAATYAAITPVRNTPATVTTASYSSSQIISFSSGLVYGAINFVDQSQNIIGIKKLEKIIVSNGSAFSAGEIISTADGKVGKIFKKDSNNPNVLFVENISPDEKYFTKNDLIDDVSPFVTAATTISSIEGYILDSSGDATADNDLRYYSAKMNLVSSPINSYLVNSTSNIKDLTPMNPPLTNNGIVFTVSPKLPEGLLLSETTGIISGKFSKPVAPTMYTITATNPLGSASTTTWLTASYAPSDLSLSTKQIITVSNTAFFAEGEALFQQVLPPLADAPTGKILKILNGYQMAIDAYDGTFLAGASLDSGSGFYSEKAYIIPDKSCVNADYLTQAACETATYTWSTGAVYYNLGLKLDAATAYYALGTCSNVAYTTQETCEAALAIWNPTYVDSAAGAKAVLAGIFKGTGYDTLYVRHVTQAATSVGSVLTFNQEDVLTGSARTVKEIDYSFIKMGVNDAASAFTVGRDVTSLNGVTPQTGGHIYKVTGTAPGNVILSVSDITRNPTSTLFKFNDTLYPSEFATGAGSANIDSVTHDVFIVTEVGKKTLITPTLSFGTAVYTIVPALPTGLTLDGKTGKISGTPTILTPRKDYTLSASNFLGQSTYVFSLEVRDYFTISENSGAPSFLLHKVGDTQVDRKCRVDANDILNNTGVLDVRCHLEGQEEDLSFKPIKFESKSGPGVCQYIQYAPYYLWQYSPVQTDATVSWGTSKTGFCSTPAPSTDDCDGNYAAYGADGPNCDEGKVMYMVQLTKDDGAGNCIDDVASPAVAQYITCGGKKVNCMAGPVKDLLSDAELTTGFRSMMYQAANGLTQSWTLTSPLSHADKTNLRVANSTTANACTTSTADVNTWTAATAATANTTNPYGQTSPYYTFNCLNAASQIKARIRVIVRDWDVNFKIDSGIDLEAPLGSLMNNSTADSYSYPYNNHADFDNDYASLGRCSIPAYTTEYLCTAYGGTWKNGGSGTCSIAPETNTTKILCDAVLPTPGVWYTGAADYLGGTCTGFPAFTSKIACEAAGHPWVPKAYAAGTCSAGGFTTKTSCEAAGNTWSGTCGEMGTNGVDFAFPGEAL